MMTSGDCLLRQAYAVARANLGIALPRLKELCWEAFFITIDELRMSLAEPDPVQGTPSLLRRQGRIVPRPPWSGSCYVRGHSDGNEAWRPVLRPSGRRTAIRVGTEAADPCQQCTSGFVSEIVRPAYHPELHTTLDVLAGTSLTLRDCAVPRSPRGCRSGSS